MKNATISEMTSFSEIPVDCSWSFLDKTTRDTSYITHGYYTYPAKFIPQLAARLIRENSKEGDVIIDPFMGSGTTIVESIVSNRIGIGTDINEFACLLAKVKTTPIKTSDLLQEFSDLQFDLQNRLNKEYDRFLKKAEQVLPKNKKIDYWFLPQQKEKLSIIFARILEIKNNDIKDFFLIAFAQILKSCSIWSQKSVKPTRDLRKKVYDPFSLFLNQSEKMLRKHSEFEKILDQNVKNNIDEFRIVKCSDSRNLPCKEETATLVVTSPPYVTSYEYADLHQLPSLWLGYLNELSEFRKKFIGSAYKEDNEKTDMNSSLAEKIVLRLEKNKKRREVKNYFIDMLESFLEMKRVLKKGGRACVVIGNAEFYGIKILCAEVFQEQFENIGFKTCDIIHKEIRSKMLPSTRDANTGRFTKTINKNSKLVYPTEYILIMEKL